MIELFYNPTKALVAVPNVAGRTVADAGNILGESGFQFTEQTEESTDVPEGLVIRTDPPADSRVPQETSITMYVSGGPSQVSVPPVIINDPEAEAPRPARVRRVRPRRRGPHRGRRRCRRPAS